MSFSLRHILRLFPLLFAGLLAACSGSQQLGEEALDAPPPADYKPPVYLTGSVWYDSVGSSKLAMDVYKVDANGYPKSVKLYARVFDSSGRFVHGLAAPYYKGTDDYRKFWSTFTEQVGRKPKENIKEFSVREFGDGDNIPYAISLTLDHSGSMGDRIFKLQDAAVKFIEKMYPNDELGVVKFDNNVRIEFPLMNRAGALASFQKNGLKGYGGYTSLFQAALTGVHMLDSASPEKLRVMVLFTDGEDNASGVKERDVFLAAKANDVHLFAIGFGFINDESLRNLAEQCGGKYYHAWTTEELYNVFEDIYRSLRNYYVVDYSPLLYNGTHRGHLELTIPGATGTLAADYQYDKSPLNAVFDTIGTMRSQMILFDFAKATIRDSSSFQIIDEWADMMRRVPGLKIEVRGHTDIIGTDERNQLLSEARAEAVRLALIQRGVEADRVRSRGFGSGQPVAPNDTEENRQKNRRTEFVIIAKRNL